MLGGGSDGNRGSGGVCDDWGQSELLGVDMVEGFLLDYRVINGL